MRENTFVRDKFLFPSNVRTFRLPTRSSFDKVIDQTVENSRETTKVIDFMPYLLAKREHATREKTFLTLFLFFVSVFVVFA